MEARGVEPLSEGISDRLSPSAALCQISLRERLKAAGHEGSFINSYKRLKALPIVRSLLNDAISPAAVLRGMTVAIN